MWKPKKDHRPKTVQNERPQHDLWDIDVAVVLIMIVRQSRWYDWRLVFLKNRQSVHPEFAVVSYSTQLSQQRVYIPYVLYVTPYEVGCAKRRTRARGTRVESWKGICFKHHLHSYHLFLLVESTSSILYTLHFESSFRNTNNSQQQHFVSSKSICNKSWVNPKLPLKYLFFFFKKGRAKQARWLSMAILSQ